MSDEKLPVYVFTGTRDMPTAWLEPLRLYVEALKPGIVIVGGCAGWDAMVARYAYGPKHSVHAVLPVLRGKWFDPHWAAYCNVFESMPIGSSFKARDTRMVACATGFGGSEDVCVAGPLHREDDLKSRRSGTWMTVRLAAGCRSADRDTALRGGEPCVRNRTI